MGSQRHPITQVDAGLAGRGQPDGRGLGPDEEHLRASESARMKATSSAFRWKLHRHRRRPGQQPAEVGEHRLGGVLGEHRDAVGRRRGRARRARWRPGSDASSTSAHDRRHEIVAQGDLVGTLLGQPRCHQCHRAESNHCTSPNAKGPAPGRRPAPNASERQPAWYTPVLPSTSNGVAGRDLRTLRSVVLQHFGELRDVGILDAVQLRGAADDERELEVDRPGRVHDVGPGQTTLHLGRPGEDVDEQRAGCCSPSQRSRCWRRRPRRTRSPSALYSFIAASSAKRGSLGSFCWPRT